MTAKEFVKKEFPSAKAERHIEGKIPGLQKTYWLIRDGSCYWYMASGTSESNAWVNAKKFILGKKHEKRTTGTI